MLSSRISNRATDLTPKAPVSSRGTSESRPIAHGDGWRIFDNVCTYGPRDRPFEQRFLSMSISVVLSGSFVYRSERGSSFLSAGGLLLGSFGHAFECSHEHSTGDRCLSFQFEPELFERIAHDRGARSRLDRDWLPPLRALAPLIARSKMALATTSARKDLLEEIAFELAGTVIGIGGDARPEARGIATRDAGRIARVLRQLESSSQPATLAELARTAGLSRYHFLRTFKRVIGITPHQWLLRARLRDAAQRLVATREPITEIALDVGFDDLSNFIRSFRAEFGVSPRHYRASG